MTDGLRERKKLATRLALHRAALELVAERGLDAVSVEEIADRAEVSPRTFFNYFATKVDAVVGLDPADLTKVASEFADRPAAETPVEALRAVHRQRAREMADESALWPLRMTVIDAHPPLVQRLVAAFGESERALAAAIAERTGTRVDADVYPTLLASVQACAMRVSLQRWLATDFTASLPDLVDEAWDVLTAGLPAPPPATR
ncbi:MULTISPECIES: TetR/AcrR family transcriptional regulator [unclassified Blastococcus]